MACATDRGDARMDKIYVISLHRRRQNTARGNRSPKHSRYADTRGGAGRISAAVKSMNVIKVALVIAQLALWLNFCPRQYEPTIIHNDMQKWADNTTEDIMDNQFCVATVSWYGDNFHGKITKYGEVYDQWGNTCACNILPYGTWVMFEHQGRYAFARVNDTGKFDKYGRLFDLSRGVADKLQVVEKGVATVNYKVVGRGREMNAHKKDYHLTKHPKGCILLLKGAIERQKGG